MDISAWLEWLSKNQGQASAIAAITGAFTALLALFVSAVSLLVSWWAAHVHRRHNKLSVRPYPEITLADFEDLLRIKLRNHGSGPLLIKSLRVKVRDHTHDKLVDAVPILAGRPWNNFSGVVDGRALLPGSEIVLLDLTQMKGEIGFAKKRDLARKALAQVTVEVDYSDVYESEFEPYCKRLGWFARHWEG